RAAVVPARAKHLVRLPSLRQPRHAGRGTAAAARYIVTARKSFSLWERRAPRPGGRHHPVLALNFALRLGIHANHESTGEITRETGAVARRRADPGVWNQ